MKRYISITITMLTIILYAGSVSVAGGPKDGDDQKSSMRVPPVTSGFLGGKFGIVDEETAAKLGLDAAGALFFLEVVEDSPAAQAGLQVDDVIIAIDGESIPDADALIEKMSPTKPGQQIKITILREKEQLDLDVTLGERPKDFPAPRPTTRP